jgi:hypothetical protein
MPVPGGGPGRGGGGFGGGGFGGGGFGGGRRGGTGGGSWLSVVRQELRDKAVPLNEWHHFAWTWDRESRTFTSYLDGESLTETKSTAGFSNTRDVFVSNRPARIGSQELPVMGSTPAIFNGSLDELWIFDEALSPIQLRNLIKANDIRGAVAALNTATNTAVATATSPGNVETRPVVEPPPLAADTAVAPPPTVPPARSSRSAVGSISNRRSSPARLAGIVTCLTVIVASCCYLLWAFIERSKLRAAGQLR